MATIQPVVTPSTKNIGADATTLIIHGLDTNASATGAGNTVTFSNGATGKVTKSTQPATLTVTDLTGLTAGTLTATVTTDGVAGAADIARGYGAGDIVVSNLPSRRWRYSEPAWVPRRFGVPPHLQA